MPEFTTTEKANYDTHVGDEIGNPHSVTKSDVGLGLADNTADLDKPISILTQEALDQQVSNDPLVGGEVALGKILYIIKEFYDEIETKDPNTLYVIDNSTAMPNADRIFAFPIGRVGVEYTYDASRAFSRTEGTPNSYTLNGVLPAGLNINGSTGVVSGIPTTIETKTGISVTGTNSYGSDTTIEVSFEVISNTGLIDIDAVEFQGAFRLERGTFGESNLSFSSAPIAYNPDNGNMFIGGTASYQAVGEFDIPALSTSTVIADLNVGLNTQPFVKLIPQAPTGNPDELDRIGGMYYSDGELIVHCFTYYDGQGNNTDTTLVVRDALNLGTSDIDGFFKFSGKMHITGWMSAIPLEYQTDFGADMITGQGPRWAIDSRNSMGPSAWGFNLSDIIGNSLSSGDIANSKYSDFSINNNMAENEVGWLDFNGYEDGYGYNYIDPVYQQGQLFNDYYDPKHVGTNTLHTVNTAPVLGMIVPGTKTYAVFGNITFLDSGGGYKIVDSHGNLGAGPEPWDRDDHHNYFWFFNVDDLLEAHNGTKESYEVKPYSWGKFVTPYDTQVYPGGENTPYKVDISGGTYDEVNDIMYLSMSYADWTGNSYESLPIIVAYKFNIL